MGIFFKDSDENKTKKKSATLPITPEGNGSNNYKSSIDIPSISEIHSSDSSSIASAGKKEEFLKFFNDAMIKNKITKGSPDYEEFSVTLEKMKTQPIDEGSKFNNAFIALETMGATKAKLLETAEGYKQVFTNEKAKFDNDMTNHRTDQITGRENTIKGLTSKNADIDKQMKQLNDQKLKNEDDMKKLEQEKLTIGSKLASQENDFNAAYNESVEKISHNVELINKYIQSAVTV